jgi:DNA helicase MCM9
LGILLSLIGGVTKTKNGITNRGDSHLLLIGEPGTGKTTLLL